MAREASLVLAALALVFALDRGVKVLAFARLALGRRASLAGLVTVRPVRNERPYGWSDGSPRAWALAYALSLASACACVALGVVTQPVALVGLGAALGGALGNVVDRARHGAVLDCFDLGRRGSFNVADVALAAGLAVLLVVQLAALAAALWGEVRGGSGA